MQGNAPPKGSTPEMELGAKTVGDCVDDDLALLDPKAMHSERGPHRRMVRAGGGCSWRREREGKQGRAYVHACD